MEATPHNVALELLRQMSADESLRDATLAAYGATPLFFIDDDDPDDNSPHVVATPAESAAEGGGDEMSIRLLASANDDDVTPCQILPGETGGDSPGARFERFALATLAAAKRTTPGASFVSHSAEWDYAGLAPLRYVIFTLTFQIIKAFGD
jgi:hypothetical protein